MVRTLTVVRLPKMKEREIEKLIREQMICRIAFKGDEYPYIVPFQYVFMDGSLYFHFAEYGRKMKLLEKNNQVCVEIEKYQPDLSEYCFIMLRGKLKIIRDPKERAEVIKMLAEEGRRKLSVNFLAAHGFKKEEGWSSFSPEKPLVIAKLEETEQASGLKSPS